eukprot:6348962-Amphidinium_carterae.1
MKLSRAQPPGSQRCHTAKVWENTAYILHDLRARTHQGAEELEIFLCKGTRLPWRAGGKTQTSSGCV